MTTTTCQPTQITPCNAGDYKLQLIVTKPTDVHQMDGIAFYPVNYKIQATCNLPSELFVVRKREARFDAATFSHEYQSVAMPADLVSIPVGSYDFDGRTRVNEIQPRFTHIEYATAYTAELQIRLRKLIDAMKALYVMDDVQSIILQ